MNNIIQASNLSFRYNSQYVLKNINLEVNEKDFMAIVGPNGGGKSTLLKIILGLLNPDSGSIEVFGQSPGKVGRKIGYVPQYGVHDFLFPIKVLDVVLMSYLTAGSILPFYQKKEKEAALEQLKALGIDHLANRRISELSGGQRQRVLIARALLSNPRLLILDEPTANIDSAVEGDVYRMLQVLNKDITIILVSHDINFVGTFVNKVTCLNVCGCTHRLDEIEGSIIDKYNYSLKVLHHRCNL